jgi:hypothetical protein
MPRAEPHGRVARSTPIKFARLLLAAACWAARAPIASTSGGSWARSVAQLRLVALADRRLRHRAGQDLLGGRVHPGRRQGADDCPPDADLDGVELGRRRWPLARQSGRHQRSEKCETCDRAAFLSPLRESSVNQRYPAHNRLAPRKCRQEFVPIWLANPRPRRYATCLSE